MENPTPIRLAICDPERFFDRDSPFADSRPHPEIVKAVWGATAGLKGGTEFMIEMELPANSGADESGMRKAFANHFREEELAATRSLREVFRDGRKALFVGFIGVALLLALAEALILWGSGRLLAAASETLVIVSWVVLWVPVEKLLFEPFPIRRHRRLAASLARSEIRFIRAS